MAMGKKHGYLAVMAAKKVKNAKITIGEKDEEYWRKNPKRFRSMLQDIAEGEDYLRSVGGMDMLEPEDDLPSEWKPGLFQTDPQEEEQLIAAFKEKGREAWQDPRVTGSKWYKDMIGEGKYWRQREQMLMQKGEEIIRELTTKD